MSSLNNIEEYLNIEIGNKRLRNGKKKMNKNCYYWFRNEYYIVNIGMDKWCIMSTGEQTRELLNDHTWHCNNHGYAQTHIGSIMPKMHRMIMNPNDDMMIDHINRNRFDNRSENLRIVTRRENNRNITKQCNNISGFTGVCKRNIKGCEYWIAQIRDNHNKQLYKHYSIKRLGDEQAKQMAIDQRNAWKADFGYIGE